MYFPLPQYFLAESPLIEHMTISVEKYKKIHM